MAERSDRDGKGGRGKPPPYEAPAIIWHEPYEPIGFGISCAKQEGNPGCFPGPTFQ
jgi:hypothetical protein